jgi:Putative prokaryotic signal transducing protein
MSDELVTVARCATPVEAGLLRSRLEAQGIPACLADDEAVGMLGVLANAMGGVKVQVPRAYEQQALAVVEEEPGAGPARGGAVGACPHCGRETEPGFEACWFCGRPLEDQPDAIFVRPSTPAAPPLPSAARADPPANPETAEAPETDQAEADPFEDSANTALVNRAWRAAILGLFIFPICLPVVSIYSFCLLLGLRRPANDLSATARSRYRIAFAVDLAVIAANLLLLIALIAEIIRHALPAGRQL